MTQRPANKKKTSRKDEIITKVLASLKRSSFDTREVRRVHEFVQRIKTGSGSVVEFSASNKGLMQFASKIRYSLTRFDKHLIRKANAEEAKEGLEIINEIEVLLERLDGLSKKEIESDGE